MTNREPQRDCWLGRTRPPLPPKRRSSLPSANHPPVRSGSEAPSGSAWRGFSVQPSLHLRADLICAWRGFSFSTSRRRVGPPRLLLPFRGTRPLYQLGRLRPPFLFRASALNVSLTISLQVPERRVLLPLLPGDPTKEPRLPPAPRPARGFSLSSLSGKMPFGWRPSTQREPSALPQCGLYRRVMRREPPSARRRGVGGATRPHHGAQAQHTDFAWGRPLGSAQPINARNATNAHGLRKLWLAIP